MKELDNKTENFIFFRMMNKIEIINATKSKGIKLKIQQLRTNIKIFRRNSSALKRTELLVERFGRKMGKTHHVNEELKIEFVRFAKLRNRLGRKIERL